MAFHLIDLDTWERAEHYQYYKKIIKTRYNLSTNIDITRLLLQIKEKGLRFYPVMIHILMQAVNSQKELRMALNKKGQLGYYDICNPSYTIFHRDDKTFSDIWTEYKEDIHEFYEDAVEDMEKYKDIKGVKTKPGKPENFCPISCVPWLSFTGYGSDTYSESDMYFPVLLMGKYFQEQDKILMPLAASVNHAVADGYHTCKLLNDVQNLSNEICL